MLRSVVSIMMMAAASPAAAQHFGVGFGVTFGEPGYYDAAPFYEDPPLVYAPEPPPVVFRMMPPDAVFDSLDERGYRDFSPMAFRDGAYKLEATDRRGDRVALELNVVTAEVMREFLIAEDVAPPPPPVRRHSLAPTPRRHAPESGAHAPAGSHDPLVVY